MLELVARTKIYRLIWVFLIPFIQNDEFTSETLFNQYIPVERSTLAWENYQERFFVRDEWDAVGCQKAALKQFHSTIHPIIQQHFMCSQRFSTSTLWVDVTLVT